MVPLYQNLPSRQNWIVLLGLLIPLLGLLLLPSRSNAQTTLSYPVVDTGQTVCYNATDSITCPQSGSNFSGQDAQYTGNAPSYTTNGDGTVTDNVTGLMWQQSHDTNGDGTIDVNDKFTQSAAETYCSNLSLAGHTDWRLPTIKEAYSLIDFRGIDVSGFTGSDTSGLTPFIDTNYFAFGYGDTSAGERVIDAQFASTTLYVAGNERMMFGVNFADGRIKGYGLSNPSGEKTFYVYCVRGDTSYGTNSFVDNSNGTITDNATGLMWAQDDSGAGLTWQEALAWAETKNSETYLGYSDWRLPNAKELQSIVDYTRSPDTTGSAAIDPLFNATSITNEAGAVDFPYYWSSTTHVNMRQTGAGEAAAYVSFGRALGYMNNTWVDVHGAGAQRSDPKAGDPADYPEGHGPQGDAIRIYNYVRLVRDVDTTTIPTPTPTVTATATSMPPTVTATATSISPSPSAQPTTGPQHPRVYLPIVRRAGHNIQQGSQRDNLPPPPPRRTHP
jgi:hypothetical protein